MSALARPLTLFAQALAARALVLAPLESESEAPFSDGETIFLPRTIADFASAEHNRGAYRVALLYQVRFLTETLTFEFAEAARKIPDLRARLLLVSSTANTSEGELARFFAVVEHPDLLRSLFSVLEQLRIAAGLLRDYPGARADLRRVLALARARRPLCTTASRPQALLEGLAQYALGVELRHLSVGDHAEELLRLLHRAAQLEADGATVYDSAWAALCSYAELGCGGRSTAQENPRDSSDPPASAPPSSPFASGSLGELPEALDLQSFAAAPLWGRLQTDLVLPRRAHGQIVALESLPQRLSASGADERASPPDAGCTQSYPSNLPLAPSADSASPSFLHDEWDYLQGRYLRGWCRVYEESQPGDDLRFLADVRRRHASEAREVRRRLCFDRPTRQQRVRRQRDGDELDLDAMIESVTDRKSGHESDGRVYMEHQPGLRDVCTAFLVDLSASTDFPLRESACDSAREPVVPEVELDEPVYLYGGELAPWPVAPAPRRRVIDVAKDSLVLMCDALHALGDRHAIYGFSGSGRQRVEFVVAKSFEEAWSARAAAAVAAMRPRRSTRTGAAIRHAITKLTRQPARTRVLILITDGYPEDVDYGPVPRDLDYGIHDTARALEEAKDAAISTFCIAIDEAGHDYLRKMCVAQRYLVVDDVSALPCELTKIYEHLAQR